MGVIVVIGCRGKSKATSKENNIPNNYLAQKLESKVNGE
jgi:hypothetical protein